MSDLDLADIKHRIVAASAAPWTTWGDGLVWADRPGDPVSASTELADAEFIAHARDDVPTLVAEVERLQRLLGADSFPTSDGYESAMQALADERARADTAERKLAIEQTRYSRALANFEEFAGSQGLILAEQRSRITALTNLLGEVLGEFPEKPRGTLVRSGYVIEETLIRWRSHLRGEG